jgi:tetratricopeptide (TPR) repeat protein
LKDNAGRVDTLKQLAALYPKKEYWTDLVTAVAQKPGFASRLALDLDRLKLATGTLTQANDYMDAAQLALLANLPGDAKTILDKGYAAGVLGTGADADRQKRLATMAGGEASQGSAGLAKQASDAAAAPKGDALEKLGETYASFGQYPQAIAAYQQAIQKGGLQYPDDAKLHLGIAQLAAGQKPQARQTLAAVTGADGTADLAQLWLLQAGA